MEQTIDGIVYSEDFTKVLRAESKDITVARIKEGVVEIETSAFLNCKKLCEIYLPSTLKLVKRCAFKNCTSLLKVELADDFAAIPSKWFNILPEQYEIICNENSKTFKAIKKSTILKSHVKSLSLKSAKSEKIKKVQAAGAQGLISAALEKVNGSCVVISSQEKSINALVSIGKNSGVFRFSTDSSKWMSKAEQIIEVLSDQTKSGQEIFDQINKSNLTLAELRNFTQISADLEGNLNIFTKGTYKRCYLKNAKNVWVFGVKEIGINAFMGAKLKSVTLTDGLEIIDEFAFHQSEIESITIPEGVTKIGAYAFASCKKLSSITLPSTLLSIDSMAFLHCIDLVRASIPKGLKKMGSDVFKDTNIKNLGESFLLKVAQSDFDGMANFTIKNGLAMADEKVLYFVNKKSNVVIPEGIEELCNLAFAFNREIKSIRLPKSLKIIGKLAFSYCEHLCEIDYEGSEKEWREIKKGEYWWNQIGAKGVKCKDLPDEKEVNLYI